MPFRGDSALFGLAPSTWTSSGTPRADIVRNDVIVTVQYPNDHPVDIRGRVDAVLNSIEQHLEWQRQEADSFNSRLPDEVRARVQNRRRQLEDRNVRLAESGIPLGHADAQRKTYIADAIVRRPSPVARRPKDAPIRLDPVLADEIFEHVLGVIRHATRQMERTPATYNDLDEEARRDVLLAALNSHYQGQATGEAFNAAGKTDILVRFEDTNLFIGECKFWTGAKSMTSALDQLQTYSTWHDTKLALVMFVREKALTQIVKSARKALEEHEQFEQWRGAASETELRARLRSPGDEERHADLNVFLVHTPPTP